MVPQDVQTDAAVRVDVGVIDASGEVNLRGLEGVVGREVDVEEENASRVWRVALLEKSQSVNDSNLPKTGKATIRNHNRCVTYRTHDSCLPVELQDVKKKPQSAIIHFLKPPKAF